MIPLMLSTLAAVAMPAVRCNTVDASGVAVPYSIEIVGGDNPHVDMKVIGTAADSIPTSNIDVSNPEHIEFDAVLRGHPLHIQMDGGFYRKNSQISGLDTKIETQGLFFMAGSCESSGDFVAVTHKFTLRNSVVTNVGGLPPCYGVAFDGRKFQIIFDRDSSGLYITTVGLGNVDFKKTILQQRPFPPLPKGEFLATSLSGYALSGDVKRMSFVMVVHLNRKTSNYNVALDFQYINSTAERPLMVARGICGVTQIQRTH